MLLLAILALCIAHVVRANDRFVLPAYQWEEFNPKPARAQSHSNVTHRRAEEFTKLPTYVSVTTISGRLDKVCDFLTTILSGTILPTHVYLFVSREPWLLDQGITESMLLASPRVQQLLQSPPETRRLFSIIFTNNLGPHRKLLPLLARKWHEDCIIITFDDESGRRVPALEGPDKLLAQLLRYYRLSDKQSVIALKTRRIGLCDVYPHFVLSYHPWWGQVSSGRHEMLLLPTGTGGVLYRPSFFHPVVFDPVLGNLTAVGDDLAFRLSTMARGVKVVAGCHPLQQRNVRGGGPCPKKWKEVALAAGGELELLRLGGGGDASAAAAASANNGSDAAFIEPNAVRVQASASATAWLASSIFGRAPLDVVANVYGNTVIGAGVGSGDVPGTGNGTGTGAGAGAGAALNATGAEDQSLGEEDAWRRKRRALLAINATAKAEAEGGLPPQSLPQPRSHTSLWGSNRLGGNDKQWKAAVDYLQGHGLLNFTSVVLEAVYKERGPCFGLGVGGAGRVEGQVALASLPLVAAAAAAAGTGGGGSTGVQRPRMCMLKTCKRSRQQQQQQQQHKSD